MTPVIVALAIVAGREFQRDAAAVGTPGLIGVIPDNLFAGALVTAGIPLAGRAGALCGVANLDFF
jgi:hypothetical protein